MRYLQWTGTQWVEYMAPPSQPPPPPAGEFQDVGSATLTAGQTSVDVPHEMGATPNFVAISFTSDFGGKRWFITDKNEDTFTFNIGGGSYYADITFDWGVD